MVLQTVCPTGRRGLLHLPGIRIKGEFAVAGEENDLGNVKGAEERRAQMRHRAESGGSVVVESPDLLTILGVGLRNLRKLVEKGFEGVAQLKQLYKDKFFGKSSQQMVEFLQTSVGIIHKNHAEGITTFIKESVDEELKENGPKPSQKKRITLCVEGNISVGKTTFLQRIANELLNLEILWRLFLNQSTSGRILEKTILTF